MKYLEGGSIGAAEQGGLKAEATEVVTRWQAMAVVSDNIEGRASQATTTI